MSRFRSRYSSCLRAFALAFALALPCSAARAQLTLVEMSNLATALQSCAITNQFYVSLESLDDLTVSIFDINDIDTGGGTFVMRPEVGLFEGARRTAPEFPGGGWQGPYATFQIGTVNPDADIYDLGSPLDLFGNPYFFFSPHGLIRGDTGVVTQELYGDAFDRYTLVSLGPDIIQSADDIFFQFNGGVTEASISTVAGPSVTTINQGAAGSRYTAIHNTAGTIRGYAFGAVQGGSQLMFGSLDLTANITAWSDTAVSFTFPLDVNEPGDLFLIIGASPTNVLPVLIRVPGGLNAAQSWTLYD